MTYTLTAPTHIDTRILLPASKSISNRALILHALCGGQTRPENLSDCDDTRVIIQALENDPETVDIMAAGTAMRFLTAYYSLVPGTHVLTGTARMKQRPIRILVNALRTLGARIEYTEQEGFPPLKITGSPLRGGSVTLDGQVSSQYISALMMMAGATEEGLTLHLTGDIVSRPYIGLTMKLMQDYGGTASWTSDNSIRIEGGGYRDVPYRIEGDWSAASYWYEIAALCPDARITLPALFGHSPQGDSKGAALFEKIGVKTTFKADGVELASIPARAARLDENLVEMPDLAQTFVVTCCMKGIPFTFGGLQSLRIKETDRMAALATELGKLGFVLHAEGDHTLRWDGARCQPQPQPVIQTYEDHRMAMSFAPASLVLPQVRIAHPEVVSKSYPHYWADLAAAGFRIEAADNAGA